MLADQVAEHTVALLTAFTRSLPRFFVRSKPKNRSLRHAICTIPLLASSAWEASAGKSRNCSPRFARKFLPPICFPSTSRRT